MRRLSGTAAAAAALLLLLAAAGCSEPSDGTGPAHPVAGAVFGSAAAPHGDSDRPVAAAATVLTQVSAARPAEVAPVPPAPAPPPLPYTYLGSWQERGQAVVFLQRNGIPHRIAGPGPLDAQYRVEAVDARRVVLRHLALGTLQDIRLDVPPPARKPALTVPVPEPVVLDSEGRPLPTN